MFIGKGFSMAKRITIVSLAENKIKIIGTGLTTFQCFKEVPRVNIFVEKF